MPVTSSRHLIQVFATSQGPGQLQVRDPQGTHRNAGGICGLALALLLTASRDQSRSVVPGWRHFGLHFSGVNRPGGGFRQRGTGPCLASRHRAVDCWIGLVEGSGRPVVRLAGRLSVAQVSELLRMWADVAPVELDLTDLVSADSGGIEALRRIRDAGTPLVGAPGYIRMRIDSREDSPVDRLHPKRREPS